MLSRVSDSATESKKADKETQASKIKQTTKAKLMKSKAEMLCIAEVSRT